MIKLKSLLTEAARAEQVKKFMAVYEPALKHAVETYPDEYGWPVSMVPSTAQKMEQAFLKGSYNHSGRAIKDTCKQLGLKHTRTAMEAFFNGGVTNEATYVAQKGATGASVTFDADTDTDAVQQAADMWLGRPKRVEEQGIGFPGVPAGDIPADYPDRKKKVAAARKQADQMRPEASAPSKPPVHPSRVTPTGPYHVTGVQPKKEEASPAWAYVKRIVNSDKRAFAAKYLSWLQGGKKGPEPTRPEAWKDRAGAKQWQTVRSSLNQLTDQPVEGVNEVGDELPPNFQMGVTKAQWAVVADGHYGRSVLGTYYTRPPADREAARAKQSGRENVEVIPMSKLGPTQPPPYEGIKEDEQPAKLHWFPIPGKKTQDGIADAGYWGYGPSKAEEQQMVESMNAMRLVRRIIREELVRALTEQKSYQGTFQGFAVSYSGGAGDGTVTVSKKSTPDSSAFDDDLSDAHGILGKFRATRPGSTWGTDGIGYVINKKAGNVVVHKSGVNPKNGKLGFQALGINV